MSVAGSECSGNRGGGGGRFLRRMEALEEEVKEFTKLKAEFKKMQEEMDVLKRWKTAVEHFVLDNFDIELNPVPQQYAKDEETELNTTGLNGVSSSVGGLQNGQSSEPVVLPIPKNLQLLNSQSPSSTQGSSISEFVDVEYNTPVKFEPLDSQEINICSVRSLAPMSGDLINDEASSIPGSIESRRKTNEIGNSGNERTPLNPRVILDSVLSTKHANGNMTDTLEADTLNVEDNAPSSQGMSKKPPTANIFSLFSTPIRQGSNDSVNDTVLVEPLQTTSGSSGRAINGSARKDFHAKSNGGIKRPYEESDMNETPRSNRKEQSPDSNISVNVEDDDDSNDIAVVFVSSPNKFGETTGSSRSSVIVKDEEHPASSSMSDERLDEDDPTPCDVCGGRTPECDNIMVFCGRCNVCIHQACYGVRPVPQGSWLCNPCKAGLDTKELRCYMCPKKGGALKPIRSPANKHWAHVSCTLWIPEIRLLNAETMEPVVDLNKVPSARWKLRCTLCNIKDGCPIQCQYNRKCTRAFHVTCAMNHGLEMIGELNEAVSGGCSMVAYCKSHSFLNGDVEKIKKKKKAASPHKKRKTEDGK